MPGFDTVSGNGASSVADISGTRFVDVTVGAAANGQTAVLAEGIYQVWSTADCYLLAETGSAGTSATNGLLLRANNSYNVKIRNGSKIGVFSTPGCTLSGFKVG